MKARYYDTAIGRKVRPASELGTGNTYWCFRVHDSVVAHVVGAILAVDVAGLWNVSQEQQAEIEHRVCEVLESIHLCDENYGAAFKLDEEQTRNLEGSQGVDVGLPPDWEFRQTNGGRLEYRTKEV